jgi:hypothetical protein
MLNYLHKFTSTSGTLQGECGCPVNEQHGLNFLRKYYMQRGCDICIWFTRAYANRAAYTHTLANVYTM